MELHTIRIDLGKTVFHLVDLNRRGDVKCALVDASSPVVMNRRIETLLSRFTFIVLGGATVAAPSS